MDLWRRESKHERSDYGGHVLPDDTFTFKDQEVACSCLYRPAHSWRKGRRKAPGLGCHAQAKVISSNLKKKSIIHCVFGDAESEERALNTLARTETPRLQLWAIILWFPVFYIFGDITGIIKRNIHCFCSHHLSKIMVIDKGCCGD